MHKNFFSFYMHKNCISFSQCWRREEDKSRAIVHEWSWVFDSTSSRSDRDLYRTITFQPVQILNHPKILVFELHLTLSYINKSVSGLDSFLLSTTRFQFLLEMIILFFYKLQSRTLMEIERIGIAITRAHLTTFGASSSSASSPPPFARVVISNQFFDFVQDTIDYCKTQWENSFFLILPRTHT